MSIENQHADPDFLKPPEPMTPERAEQFRRLVDLSKQMAKVSPGPALDLAQKWEEQAKWNRDRAETEAAKEKALLPPVLRAVATTYENLARELRKAVEAGRE